MIWHFNGTVRSKQLLPRQSVSYALSIESWTFSGTLDDSLAPLIKNARASATIMSLDAAKSLLLNLRDKGELVLSQSGDASEICYLIFWHDPSYAEDHLFSVTIGLDPVQMLEITSELSRAFFNGNRIQITGAGGFSASPDNPYSKQPTSDQFGAGTPLKFQESVKITLY